MSGPLIGVFVDHTVHKLNTTKTATQNTAKQIYSGSVASYDTPPWNEVSLIDWAVFNVPVGWVFWPVKTVSRITYTVLVGT